MSELNKETFITLIADDRKWLRCNTPRSLERAHIEMVLTGAVINFDRDKRITELQEQLAGYKRAYAKDDKRITELKEKLEIKNAVIERWEEEFDHMASQEFCEEIEVISEGDADE